MHDNFKGGALTETTFLILLALCKPKHGYSVMKFIEKETEGRVTLGASTLYGSVKTMQKKGWIELYDNQEQTYENTKKVEYIITDTGKKIIMLEMQRLKELYTISLNIVGD